MKKIFIYAGACVNKDFVHSGSTGPISRASTRAMLRQLPTPKLVIDLIHSFFLVVHLFDTYKSKTRPCENFYKRFPEFIERRIMDVIM